MPALHKVRCMESRSSELPSCRYYRRRSEMRRFLCSGATTCIAVEPCPPSGNDGLRQDFELVNKYPDPREDLESSSPNLGPYTTKGTLQEPPSRDLLFFDPCGGLGGEKLCSLQQPALFPNSPGIIRVPFFLIFSFNKGTL